MPDQRTASQIARYDQFLAGASDEVGRLTRDLQATAARAGEHEALTDLRAQVAGSEPAELAGLLTAAIWQLAGLEPEGEVGRLTGILRAKATEVGEHKALSDLCALVAGSEPAELADLLTAAIGQLAGLEPEHQAAAGPADPP
jgi:hypothetical protein